VAAAKCNGVVSSASQRECWWHGNLAAFSFELHLWTAFLGGRAIKLAFFLGLGGPLDKLAVRKKGMGARAERHARASLPMRGLIWLVGKMRLSFFHEWVSNNAGTQVAYGYVALG
jgi:hypothetical protein